MGRIFFSLLHTPLWHLLRPLTSKRLLCFIKSYCIVLCCIVLRTTLKAESVYFSGGFLRFKGAVFNDKSFLCCSKCLLSLTFLHNNTPQVTQSQPSNKTQQHCSTNFPSWDDRIALTKRDVDFFVTLQTVL